MSDSVTFSVFADLHWREGDWSWCEARLDAILDHAVREKAEFVIHCGDFCHDVAAARAMIAKYAAAPLPARHVMGNHEFECSDSLEEVLRAFSMTSNFYSFDVRGFRFVALDNNYHHGPGGVLKHYADESVWAKCNQDEMLLPPEQVEFLAEAIRTAPGPVCLFTHARLKYAPGLRGIDNSAEILRLADKARAGRPLIWFNGHHHRNRLVVQGGMAFFDVNSASSDWTVREHHAYPPEIMAKNRWSCHTLLNAEPVHAIVRLSMDGEVEISGMKGAYFMGVTPESIGIDAPDVDGLKFDADVLSASFKL